MIKETQSNTPKRVPSTVLYGVNDWLFVLCTMAVCILKGNMLHKSKFLFTISDIGWYDNGDEITDFDIASLLNRK